MAKISFQFECFSQYWTWFPTTLLLYCSSVESLKKIEDTPISPMNLFIQEAEIQQQYMVVDHSSYDDHSKEEKKSFRLICTTTNIFLSFPPISYFLLPSFRLRSGAAQKLPVEQLSITLLALFWNVLFLRRKVSFAADFGRFRPKISPLWKVE